MEDAGAWREAESVKDILLDRDGDIHIGPESDIDITDSVVQAIRVRLLWFLGECVLYPPETGTDYFGAVFGKNVSPLLAASEIRSQILLVDEVTEVPDVTIDVDSKTRNAVIRYTARTEREVIRNEVVICRNMG